MLDIGFFQCIEVEIRRDQFFSKIMVLRVSTDTRSFENFFTQFRVMY